MHLQVNELHQGCNSLTMDVGPLGEVLGQLSTSCINEAYWRHRRTSQHSEPMNHDSHRGRSGME